MRGASHDPPVPTRIFLRWVLRGIRGRRCADGGEEEMSEQTVKCPICGEPYVVYMMMVGDQSACFSCRMKARRQSYLVPHQAKSHEDPSDRDGEGRA